jgi:hypothetical protein
MSERDTIHIGAAACDALAEARHRQRMENTVIAVIVALVIFAVIVVAWPLIALALGKQEARSAARATGTVERLR